MFEPFFVADDFILYQSDCCKMMEGYSNVDMIFADPPYFLSNDGLTVNSGKIVSVNKGDWDRKKCSIDEFNYNWIKVARESLSAKGTIWICGTMHNIFSVVKILTDLDFKILNTITWKKKNPPPNFSCRYFTHSTEFIIWARKNKNVAHFFNYDLMKLLNGGKQMKDVWEFSSAAPWEKKNGKHPTQKPLSLLCRIILASTMKGATILDPFCGSCTTGIAASLLGRKFIGSDIAEDYLEIGINRYKEILNNSVNIIPKIAGLEQYANIEV